MKVYEIVVNDGYTLHFKRYNTLKETKDFIKALPRKVISFNVVKRKYEHSFLGTLHTLVNEKDITDRFVKNEMHEVYLK